MKHFIHYVVAALFFLSAVVQWNDPDPIVWIIIYASVSAIVLLYALGKPIYYFSLSGLIICLIGSAIYIPDAIQWAKDGMPNIAGSMKAESQYIEFMREFFGLLVCSITLFIYFRKSQKDTL